ncbi:MAG: hypothetical protein Kow00129_03150 [Thermoleophilia bacterium]
MRENARAQIRVLVKHTLRKHGYPPDEQQRATDLVLQQAEVLCDEWSIEPVSERWEREAAGSAEPFLRVVPTDAEKY